ncbi:MAG TPA: MopE-related protein, partial [Polyangiaceae bacterium]|nr:MopE-related protein [Polyangiaceae bacterium]
MRLPRSLLGLLLGGALAPVACGDDSSGHGAVGGAGEAGEAGSPETGKGGSSDAGAGPSSGAGDAAMGGAEPGSGGEGNQAGEGNVTACTARDQIPDPVAGNLVVQPTCKAPSGCNGTLKDGQWAYSDVCIEQGAVFEPLYSECPTSHLNGPADIVVDGVLQLADGKFEHTATVSATGVFQVPVACAACNCQEYDDVLKKLGAGPNTYCYPECYPDNSCRCLVDFELNVDESGNVDAAANKLIADGGRSYEVCVGAGTLALTESGAAPNLPGTVALTPFASTITPEICDGVDNDKNGKVDDAPQDCPATPCNEKGVCAGTQAMCAGFWTCDYSTAPYYEMGTETTCDGLDNDCDGEVDEGLVGCYEKCDGFDNDNNGKIDDKPQDNPCGLAKLGVCATGVTATCLGKDGWQCDFDATGYEPEESTCGDGKDNDCDGQVDEGCACPLGKSQMFVVQWGNSPALLRADLDGKNAVTIPALSGSALGQVAVDPKNNKLYYSDAANHISRANLDGSSPEVLWTGQSQTWAVNPFGPLLLGECNTSNICKLNSPNTTMTLVQPAAATWVNIDP